LKIILIGKIGSFFFIFQASRKGEKMKNNYFQENNVKINSMKFNPNWVILEGVFPN